MGQQRPQRDRFGGWFQDRLAGIRIEAVQHLQRSEFLDVRGRRFIQLQFPLFHQLHGGDGGDRLGHGRDHEDAVGIDIDGGGGVAFAEGSRISGLISSGGHGDAGWDFVLFERRPQGLADALFASAPNGARLCGQSEQRRAELSPADLKHPIVIPRPAPVVIPRLAPVVIPRLAPVVIPRPVPGCLCGAIL